MSGDENNFSVIGWLFSSTLRPSPPVRLSRTPPLVLQKILFMKAADYSSNKPARGMKLHLGRIIHFFRLLKQIILTNTFALVCRSLRLYMCEITRMNFSASHKWNLSLPNLSQFRRAAVKINSIVILSGIDWVWNCNQTATITLTQIDTTEINDVYKSPWNSVYIVILLVSVIVYYEKNVPLMKCNFGPLLERSGAFLRATSASIQIFKAEIYLIRSEPRLIHLQSGFNETPLSQI